MNMVLERHIINDKLIYQRWCEGDISCYTDYDMTPTKYDDYYLIQCRDYNGPLIVEEHDVVHVTYEEIIQIKCDHIIGYDRFNESECKESERHLISSDEFFRYFKYCPDCGTKLEKVNT